MQTGDEEGRWKRETEEVYPKRTLIFLLALVFVFFIIHIIIGNRSYFCTLDHFRKIGPV